MKFLQDITLGQYLPGDSLLHHLDPRTKFISMLLLMTLAFLIQSFRALAALWAFFFVALFLSRIPWRYIFRGTRPFIWLFLLTGVVHLFFTPGPSLPLFPLGFVNITWPGVERGALVSGQLIFVILVSSLMTLTTPPMRLVHGLEKLISPLKRFHVPVEDFSLMTMLAIRFIPILLAETNRIIKAQSARGVDFESGNLLARGKKLIPVLIPLFNGIFKRADDLATAMLARGYRPGAKRTYLHPLKMGRWDYATLTAMGVLVLLEIGYRG